MPFRALRAYVAPGGSQQPPGGGGLGSLWRDRRAQLGLAGAVGVGLVLLVLRHRGAAGGSPDAGADASAATGGTVLRPGTYDSTGSDIYNGLQSISQGWTDQFADLAKQIGDVQSRLPAAPTTPVKAAAPLQRKAAGGTAMPIKSLPTSTPTGRWSWTNLVSQFYDTSGYSSAELQAAGQRLADANKQRWFGVRPGPNQPYTQSTVRGGVAVTVPARL
jgi:hypothetical protein